MLDLLEGVGYGLSKRSTASRVDEDMACYVLEQGGVARYFSGARDSRIFP